MKKRTKQMLRHRRKYIIFLGALIAAVILFVGNIFWHRSHEIEVVKPQMMAMPVAVRQMESLQSVHREFVKMPYTAHIASYAVKVGDDVEKGQLLATVDVEALQSQIQLLEEALQQPQENTAVNTAPMTAVDGKALELLKNGVITKKEYERMISSQKGMQSPQRVQSSFKIENDSESMRRQIAMLQSIMKNPQITAPMEGRVSAIYNEEQKLIIENRPFMVIQSYQPLVATVIAPFTMPKESLEARIKESGQESIGFIEKVTIQPYNKGTASVLRVIFKNENKWLKPGKNYDMTVQSKALEEMLVIPALALHKMEDGYYVYILTEDDHIDRRLVTVGAQKEGQIAIIRGLSPEDRVIMTNREFTVGTAISSENIIKD